MPWVDQDPYFNIFLEHGAMYDADDVPTYEGPHTSLKGLFKEERCQRVANGFFSGELPCRRAGMGCCKHKEDIWIFGGAQYVYSVFKKYISCMLIGIKIKPRLS